MQKCLSNLHSRNFNHKNPGSTLDREIYMSQKILGILYVGLRVKELLPFVISVVIWEWQWSGKLVKVRCDIAVAVHNLGTVTKHLLRSLFFWLVRTQVTLDAVHIPERDNGLAENFSVPQYSIVLLNQWSAGLWLACTWFLKIDFVQIVSMHVRVCVCVCVCVGG